MALAHSFYAEQAAVRGDLDEARRRRLVVLDFYGDRPRTVRRGGAFVLAGQAGPARRRPRRRPSATTGPPTEGFGRLDRPVMSSICLGMVADFDERAGDYPAAIRTLEAAIETNESLLGGFTGVAAGAPRMGAAPRRRSWNEPRRCTGVRSTRPAGCATPWCSSRPRPGWPSLHRLHGRDDAAVAAATEALELYRADGFRRFRNRIDPTADLQACRGRVLRGARRDRRRTGRPERAAALLRTGRPPADESGVEVPALSSTTTWPGPDVTTAALGSEALAAPASRSAAARLTGEFSASAAQVSALLDGAVVPQAAGPTPGGSRERIPVPPRSQQRPAPVPGAGPLARRRRRRHGAARQRRRPSSTTASASPASSPSTPPTS